MVGGVAAIGQPEIGFVSRISSSRVWSYWQSRVGEGVAPLAPHRSGRADFPHPAPHPVDSLRRPSKEGIPVPLVRRSISRLSDQHRYPSSFRGHDLRLQCTERVSLRRFYHDVVSFPPLGPPGGSVPGFDGTMRRSDFPVPLPSDLWIRRSAPAPVLVLARSGTRTLPAAWLHCFRSGAVRPLFSAGTTGTSQVPGMPLLCLCPAL
jgi:hypothetical protein